MLSEKTKRVMAEGIEQSEKLVFVLADLIVDAEEGDACNLAIAALKLLREMQIDLYEVQEDIKDSLLTDAVRQ